MPSQRCSFRSCRFLGVLFLGSLTLCLWLSDLSLTALPIRGLEIAIAQSATASQLVEQGIERYQAGKVPEAIAFWQEALTLYQNSNDLAQGAIVREKLALGYQQIGQYEQAIDQWQKAIASARQLGNSQAVGRLLTEQAQTYNRLGQPQDAIALLCGVPDPEQDCTPGSALQIAKTNQDLKGEAAAWGSLAEVYRLTGKYQAAIKTLNRAEEIDYPDYRSSVLNSLGNAYFSQAQFNEYRAESAQQRGAPNEDLTNKAKSDYAKALDYFNRSLQLTRTQNNPSVQMQAILNLIRFYLSPQADNSTPPFLEVEPVVQQALTLLKSLPDSPDKVYAAIDLADIIKQPISAQNSCQTQYPPLKIDNFQGEELLNLALSIAKKIKDPRSQSFALGKLGNLYECRQDYDQASDFTNQARWTADQNLRAKDSLYLWEWQAGRIFKAQGKESAAIGAYERAIAILEGQLGIRNNLLTAQRDLQFNFRDTISPLYREFAQLMLERAQQFPIKSQDYQKDVEAALKTIDSLKLAELENYFRQNCELAVLDEELVNDLEREDTATFSSIILEDRTAMVVSLPNPEKKSHPNAAKRLKKFQWVKDTLALKEEIKSFREKIQESFERDPTLFIPNPNLYNWLIQPFATDLDPAQIKTLVFIQDGILRSIPMAALHDGKEYLVEKYAIATTPGLRLTSPKSLKIKGLRVLALGLTQAATVEKESFPALPNVRAEIEQVKAQFSGSKTLLNEQFTPKSLEQEIEQTVYPIIHIATHGQFGTIPEDTFLVTGDNQKITITELEQNIRRFSRDQNPVELLTLTACQTAVGDDRTTLGMAGITVQAGVRSALASLWFIDDAVTKELVNKFYTNLQLGKTKAEALQQAQKALINQEPKIHPAKWAPFILIGNWL